MKKDLTDTLRKLAAGDEHRSESARLRDFIDEIEDTLQAGVSREAILKALHQHGFTMSMSAFCSALYRIRKQRGTQPARRKKTAQGVEQPKTEESPGQADLTGMSKKQRREHLADQFIKPETTNPLLKRFKKKESQ